MRTHLIFAVLGTVLVCACSPASPAPVAKASTSPESKPAAVITLPAGAAPSRPARIGGKGDDCGVVAQRGSTDLFTIQVLAGSVNCAEARTVFRLFMAKSGSTKGWTCKRFNADQVKATARAGECTKGSISFAAVVTVQEQ
jgi:hypothetical protein